MRVVFVQTYPVYHDGLSAEAWLKLENRDRWMPGMASSMGHEVELWAGGDDEFEKTSQLDGFGEYTIRVFTTERSRRPTKFHASEALIDHARKHPADLYVLKGLDGGAGERLLSRHIIPDRRLFAFVIGGKFYTPRVPLAAAVFYETEAQREELAGPSRPWRRRVEERRLIRLPKSVDTAVFAPRPDAEVEWDVISVGRIDERLKKFELIGDLAEKYRVAVVGGGPSLDRMKRRYPSVEWLGRQPNAGIPRFMQRARLFLFEGVRDYFPRVIAEAAACGLPVVASNSVAIDALPPSIGIRARPENLLSEVEGLLAAGSRRREMADSARRYAVRNWGIHSSEYALRTMFDMISDARPIASSSGGIT